MSTVNVLILDFSVSQSALAKALHLALAPAIELGIQIRLEQVDSTKYSADTVPRLVSESRDDLAFLVLPPTFVEEGHTMLRMLQADRMPVIVVTESEPYNLPELLKWGPCDCIMPPFKSKEILPRLWRLLNGSVRSQATRRSSKEVGLEYLVGDSASFCSELRKLPAVAQCDASVLIVGETGTGKELFARAIHFLSPRSNRAFVPVNCGAMSVELVENELFGHERGAFTSATTSQKGLVHEADGGTLFLDEIDCLPIQAQVKLLRFLQEKEYRSLGSTKICKANVRIVAATNADLEDVVRCGGFRRDLYYRLNVVPLMMPPLRERQEDIPQLARYFLNKYASKFKRASVDFTWGALQLLLMYDWPGNVRELEHIVERAVVLADQEFITREQLVIPGCNDSLRQVSLREMKTKLVLQFERACIKGLLQTYSGNISKAADAAGKNRRAFWQLIQKHRIDVQEFRSTSTRVLQRPLLE